MSSHGRAWLDSRARDVPPSLATRMRLAVDVIAAAAPPDVPGELAAAALACLQQAFDGCDERDAALHLLAADALVTGACEAAAGAVATPREAALEALCAEMSLERLSLLLPQRQHGDGSP
jgi:hypothetical protein